jgi:asparagine synthase (glutamine-hydrolysing)
LFALGDRRGAAAASETLARVTRLVGDPDVLVSDGPWLLAGWGRSLTRSANFVVQGLARTSAADNGDSFVRFVSAQGDFAVVGADDQGLFLASGPGGGYRPVYVAAPGDGRILACTSVEVLRALVAAPIDPDMLVGYAAAATTFSTSGRHPERTLFSGILCLPMYEAWHAAVDGSVRRHDTFLPLQSAAYSGDPVELSSILRDSFRGAVRRAMEGHEVVGVMAGGGLDSSSLTAMTVDLVRTGESAARLHVFAWDHATFHGDDRPYLGCLARYLRIEPFRTTAQDAGKVLGTTFVAGGMPYYHPLSPFLAASSAEARRRGATVLLSGAGGDDVVDGNPTLLSELARRGRPFEAVLKAVLLRGPYMGGPGWRVRQYVARPLIRGATPIGIRRSRYRRALQASYPWAGARLGRYLDEVAETPPGPPPGIASTPAARFEALARPPYLFRACLGREQEEALAGCARRDPFFDDDFMRTVARLPPLTLLHGDFRRGLMREAMRGLLPDEIRWRKTKAVMEPALRQMVEAAGGFRTLDNLADVRMLAELGIAEPRAFRRSFDQLVRDPDRGPWIRIWPALAAEAFLRTGASAS